ncbi:hypothetical protein V7S43_000327 [Phytophthora oleae]|uniref:Uncharacterized protein n=1 Tax=Phytophthora oleae TaxID=2107226 RepID=A0ABD3G706_9STRA
MEHMFVSSAQRIEKEALGEKPRAFPLNGQPCSLLGPPLPKFLEHQSSVLEDLCSTLA